MEFDTQHGRVLGYWASLSGTVRNCAGGQTPWGSWLTCEETTLGIGNGDLTKNHGYIFEVPASGSILTANPVRHRYKAMGRFSHEAVAVDPATGWVYETEDAGSNSGFYRFRPTNRGVLEDGGVLRDARHRRHVAVDTRTGQTGDWRDVEWHVIDVPDPTPAAGATSVFRQGRAKGAAVFGKLEGAWFGNGRHLLRCEQRRRRRAGSGLRVRRGAANACGCCSSRRRRTCSMRRTTSTVSPRGGLVLCEDGGGTEYVHGLTTDGVIFRFAQNNVDLRDTPINGFSRTPGQRVRRRVLQPRR